MTAPNEKGQTENKNLTQDTTFPWTQDRTEIREETLSSIVDEIAEEISLAIGENDKPSPSSLSEIVINSLLKRVPTKTIIGVKGEAVGIYIYDKGVYREGEELIKALFHKILKKIRLIPRIRSYTPYENDFIVQLKRETASVSSSDPHLVVYNDLLFDWRKFIYEGEGFLMMPSPEYFVLNRVPWSLDREVLIRNINKSYEEIKENAHKELMITRTFEQWAGDKWPVLFEISGYCLLSGENPLKKAIMLVDAEGRDGDTGKTAYCSFLEKLIGEENVSKVPLQDLTDDSKRFMRWYLYGKMANIYPDLPEKAIRETGHFKALTGEDKISADRKHRDAIEFRNYAKLIFGTNKLPKVGIEGAGSDAFFRRWILVPFVGEFHPIPRYVETVIEEILRKEAGKILSYSLLAVKNVVEEEKFSFQEGAESYRERWLRETDSIYDFLRTGEEEGFLEFGSDKRVESKTLYNAYVKFCDREEATVVGKKTFTIRLEELGYLQRNIGGERYYMGLSLKGDITV